MIFKFIKKMFARNKNNNNQNKIITSQYSKEAVHPHTESAYAVESTQSIFHIICNNKTKNTKCLPQSVQQYLTVLNDLQNYYSLPLTINGVKDITRKIQILYALYHQHIISYIKPSAPINNRKVRDTYKYLTTEVKDNKYCDKPKEFYKKLYQTISYNKNHKY